MANYNRASAFFFMAVLLAAASTPPAHGQPYVLRGLTVSGSLCCTPTGNCPGQGVSGVPVRLNCTILRVGPTVLGSSNTNKNGTFTITVPRVKGLLLGNLPFVPCVTTVQLPLRNKVCPALNSTTGILASALRNDGIVRTFETASLVGFVKVAP